MEIVMEKDFKITLADAHDISELYQLQLLAFESEAEMIGSRDVPALMETEEHNRNDFVNWTTYKMVNQKGKIIAAIRYKKEGEILEIGRLMVHPDYRQQGLAQRLVSEVDRMNPYDMKELYTCTKSWINIRLYQKMGYTPVKEVSEDTGLSFVYMRREPKVKIEMAVIEDLPAIMRIQDIGLESVQNKDWYAIETEEFMRKHICAQGFTLKAVVNGIIAGFLTVRYPWKDDDNLGEYIGLSDEEKMFVVHMESAAVLPEYRGMRIQNQLMAKGFELLKETEYKYVMGTAHPDNVYSVNNFLKLGYEIVADVKKYGGLRRYVFNQRL